jgi:hypothetical protein
MEAISICARSKVVVLSNLKIDELKQQRGEKKNDNSTRNDHAPCEKPSFSLAIFELPLAFQSLLRLSLLPCHCYKVRHRESVKVLLTVFCSLPPRD